MIVTILLLGALLFGLILLAVGVVLLLKVKNKLPGLLAIVVGLVLTFGTSAIFLALVITTSVSS
jgi:hypothetical protein